jgi:hypothetical protein
MMVGGYEKGIERLDKIFIGPGLSNVQGGWQGFGSG